MYNDVEWALLVESNPTLDSLSDRLLTEFVIVPPVWPLEIGHVLLMAVKRGRLTAGAKNRLVREFRDVPVEIDVTFF